MDVDPFSPTVNRPTSSAVVPHLFYLTARLTKEKYLIGQPYQEKIEKTWIYSESRLMLSLVNVIAFHMSHLLKTTKKRVRQNILFVR